jgi:DNA-binding response OmpR family regulator
MVPLVAATMRLQAAILDIQLEARDTGWSVLAALKAEATLRSTPIIVCSADQHAVKQHTAELQRDGCVVLDKPFELDTLLAVVHRLIDRRDAAPASAETA